MGVFSGARYKQQIISKTSYQMNDRPRSSTITSGFSGLRTGLAVEDINQSLIDNLFCGMGRVPAIARRNDLHTGLALIVHDRVFYHGVPTIESLGEQRSRRVAYLSAEYLPGPHVVLNLGITDQMRQTVSELGYDLDRGRENLFN
jgi:glycogen phosphorylase